MKRLNDLNLSFDIDAPAPAKASALTYPSNEIEITATYLGEKPNTRKPTSPRWAVHNVRLVSDYPCGLREGMGIEVSGESEPYEWGDEQEPELQSGCDYRFLGKLFEGREFRGQKTPVLKFRSFLRCQPVSKQAVLRYLQEAPHIGSKIATALVEKFGADAVKVLRETPAVAATAVTSTGRRLTTAQAELAAFKLREMFALENVTMEMMDLLAGYGLPKATAKKAIQKWGNKAAEIVKGDPLESLMSFRGCGFLRADKVYQSLGFPLNALKRMTLCAWHYLHSDSNGHTWHRKSSVLDAIRQNVGGIRELPLSRKPGRKPKSRADRAINRGIRSGLLASYTDEQDQVWLAEGVKAREEKRLADTVLAAMDEENPWRVVLEHPRRDEFLAPLSDHQREQLFKALSGGALAILGGGPGTGKTFTAACLIRLLIEIYGEGAICGTALTGKAATRLSEGMAKYLITLQAKTTHSLLKVKNFNGDAADDDSDEQSEFEFNSANPLPFMVINADEWSMNGVPLALALLSARARGCAVLIIGDIHQLLPIEHGAPLRDLIAAGLPYGELTEIRRNAGQVVRMLKKLRDDEKILPSDFCRFDQLQPDADDPINCALVPAYTADAVRDETVKAVKGMREKFGYDAIWDVQVVVATNKQRTELNGVLQRELNPAADVDPKCKYRIGDKIIALQNAQYPLIDTLHEEIRDSAVKVNNGEFGRVIEIQDKKIIAHFSTPNRTVALRKPYVDPNAVEEKKDADAVEPKMPFDLGYAATCHKMQGSQAKGIVVALDKNTFNTSCEWFHTADSRPEKVVVNVGEFATIVKMAEKKELWKRKTFLKEEIESGRLFGERVWWVEQNQLTGTVTT